MTLHESIEQARDRSTVRVWLERVVGDTGVLDRELAWPAPASRVAAGFRSSVALDTYGNVAGAASDIAGRSGSAAASRALVAATRSSAAFRWLTAEPDPEVVVVDLDDALIVGPPLRATANGLDTFPEWSAGSRLVGAGRRSVAAVEEVPVRAVSIVTIGALVASLAVSVVTGSATVAGIWLRLGLGALAIIGLGNDTSLDELRESRAARWLVAALEPPESRVNGPRTGGGQDEEGHTDRTRDEEA